MKKSRAHEIIKDEINTILFEGVTFGEFGKDSAAWMAANFVYDSAMRGERPDSIYNYLVSQDWKSPSKSNLAKILKKLSQKGFVLMNKKMYHKSFAPKLEEGTGEMAFRKHIPNDEKIPDELEEGAFDIKIEKKSKWDKVIMLELYPELISSGYTAMVKLASKKYPQLMIGRGGHHIWFKEKDNIHDRLAIVTGIDEGKIHEVKFSKKDKVELIRPVSTFKAVFNKGEKGTVEDVNASSIWLKLKNGKDVGWVNPSYVKKINEASSVPPFWKTPEAEGAKEYFYGKTVGDMKGKKQGDLVLTQKGEMFKFIHGSENTSKQPFLKFVKKIKVPKFPVDDNIEIDGKTWQPLGSAEIFKLKDGKFLWEY